MELEEKLVGQVLKHYKYLSQRRTAWEDVWKEISEYVIPRISNFETSSPGRPEKRGGVVFNGKPRNLIRIGSYGYQGYLTPRSGVWFSLEPDDPKLLENKDIRKWFQDGTEAMISELARSNFYDQLGPAYENGLSIGTSTMSVQDDEKNSRLDFEAVHPKQIFIARDSSGNADTHYRDFYMTGKAILQVFGEEALDADTLLKIRTNPYEEFRVIHATFPRDERIYERIDAENKPIASIYILHDSRKLLRKSGLDLQHYFTWCHSRNSDEEYGISPSWDALVDILRANAMAKAGVNAANLSYKPPVMYTAGLKPYLDLDPGGRIPVTNPMDMVKKIDMLGNYQITLEIERQLNEQIKDHFMVDFFLMLSQSDRTKTALEAGEIAGEKAALLSAVVGGIESELLDPALVTSFWIAWRAGRLPEPPPALIEAGGTDIKINYTGPLALLQKRHHGQQTTTHTLAQAAPVFNLFPEARDYVDGDKLIKKILQQGYIDQDIIRDDRMVEMIRKARIQKAMEDEQKASFDSLLKNLKNTNMPIEPGSPLEALMGTIGGGV